MNKLFAKFLLELFSRISPKEIPSKLSLEGTKRFKVRLLDVPFSSAQSL